MQIKESANAGNDLRSLGGSAQLLKRIRSSGGCAQKEKIIEINFIN